MAGTPPQPRPCGQPGDAEPPEHVDTREQRAGPLALERLVKPDGRALILYTREEPS